MSDDSRATTNNSIYKEFCNGMKYQSREHVRLAGDIARRITRGTPANKPFDLLDHTATSFCQVESHLDNIENNLNKVCTLTRQHRLDQIPNVDIDPSGKFKYILIEVKDPETKAEKCIVRGYKSCSYHVDIFESVEPSITKLKCKAKCVGGGRILHDPNVKSILVYGYSQGFGRANHEIAKRLLEERYPDYNDISWSNEGY